MEKIYICSPYRAKGAGERNRNIKYAQQLTRQAIEAGFAPITPHLYMTQCLNEDDPKEREAGMAAGLALLESCDFIMIGDKYGFSEDMKKEMVKGRALGIKAINENGMLEIKKKYKEIQARNYAEACACNFCTGGRLHSCTGYDCREPYNKAYEYKMQHLL